MLFVLLIHVLYIIYNTHVGLLRCVSGRAGYMKIKERSYYDLFDFHNKILNRLFKKKNEEKKKIEGKEMSTASGIPRRSPIQVLTGLDVA